MSFSSESSSKSSKLSSSSVSSSSKMSSSALSSSALSSSSALRGISNMSSEVDDLLAASASARQTARGLSSGLSERLGALTSDLDIDDMMSRSSLGGGNTSTSSSSVSSSSKKAVAKISSISQSSVEIGDGPGDSSVKSSVKSHSSSVASSSLLASQQRSVDGEIVSAETVAEKSSRARESQKEKVVEDGQVLVDTGFKMEQTSAAKLRATKEMSQEELDSFFKGDAITGKPLEALNFDKDNNTFEVKLNDLPEFSPQELTVKIVDNVITVYGTHEEKNDENNYKMYQYVRRFTVPKGLKTDNIDWSLEPSGTLAITAGDSIKGGTSQAHLDCTIFKPRSFFKSLPK